MAPTEGRFARPNGGGAAAAVAPFTTLPRHNYLQNPINAVSSLSTVLFMLSMGKTHQK